MPVEITIIQVDATFNPGSGESMDIANVSITYTVDQIQRGQKTSIPVPLPSGTIVQDVKKAERSAYEQAAEILTQLSDAARKEALK